MKIGFIGAGNMAGALIRGICGKNLVDPKNIYVSNPSQGKLDVLQADCGVNTTNDNKAAAAASDILFLCVKPQKMDDVLFEIRNCLKKDVLVVSVAAGKTLAYFAQNLGEQVKTVRVMPNAPALVGAGICAVTPGEAARSDEKLPQLMSLLTSIGSAEFVEEPMIDIAGQIAGASPAWISMVIEALADGAVFEGMSREMAYKFAAAGVYGAGLMAAETGGNPGKIKDMVASPKGTTIEGIRVLEERGVRAAFIDAVIASCEKSSKL